MKTGMNLLLWTGHVTEDHVPVLRALKKTGFDGVEVPVFDPSDTGHYRWLAGVLGEDLIELLAHLNDETGLDLDVRSLTLSAAMRLVEHHSGVGQRVALTHGPTGEDYSRGRGGHAHAHRVHLWLDVLHRVVDSE